MLKLIDMPINSKPNGNKLPLANFYTHRYVIRVKRLFAEWVNVIIEWNIFEDKFKLDLILEGRMKSKRCASLTIYLRELKYTANVKGFIWICSLDV